MLSAIAFINLIAALVTSQPTAVVNTTSGPVRGQILSTVLNSVEYAAFKGIKYAQAPEGRRRFQPPIPVDPWTEIFNATVEGPCCMQYHRDKVIGSEDCLSLNVFTPVTNLAAVSKPLSVMVWFYGGAWLTGSSSTVMYGPDYLVERNIVVVTLNYRGGAFGFLSLDHPNATGNMGLKDQRLALKWVQSNIANFGGNPNNVTISGGSSGAASVGYHIVSDASVGLFHGAISMSGTPLILWGFQPLQQAIANAQILGSLLGRISEDKTALLETLYEASAADIVIATLSVGRVVSFEPTLENASFASDVFLSKCTMFKYYTGNFTKVPQMIGFMDQEGVTYTYCRKKEMLLYLQTITYLMDVVHYLGMEMPPSLPRVLETFDSWRPDNFTEFENEIIGASAKVMSDFLFISPVDLTQRILAVYNDDKPVYYYHVSFDMERSPHNIMRDCIIPGAGHGDELAYLFHAPAAKYNLDPETPLGVAIYRFTTLYTNFVKYGNPTPDWVDEYPLNITWPDSGPQGYSLNIGDDLTIGPRPMDEDQRNMESYYSVRLPQIQGCV